MNITPFKLERYFARYEFSARYLLCSSDCESWSVQELLDLEPGSEERLKRLWLGYTESPGSLSLREEITRLYAGIDPNQVLVHSGAEEAIFLFMQAVLQPGDHVLVHWPCYQSLHEVARSLGCEITYWEAHPENEWTLDLDQLRKNLRPTTRAVVVNTPHNPTGHLMLKSEFLELNKVCQERGITLFSDEVYRLLEYDPADRLPSACEINPTSVSLGVMSKSYGLAGLRIGWIASRNAHVLEKMASLKDYTTICNSAPSEYLSELALHHGAHLVARNLKIIQSNLTLLDKLFLEHSSRFSWIRPKAGSIAFPMLLVGDVQKFCHDLVTSTGVLLLPGTLYDHPGNHFRIGFGRKNMLAALQVLEEHLNG